MRYTGRESNEKDALLCSAFLVVSVLWLSAQITSSRDQAEASSCYLNFNTDLRANILAKHYLLI